MEDFLKEMDKLDSAEATVETNEPLSVVEDFQSEAMAVSEPEPRPQPEPKRAKKIIEAKEIQEPKRHARVSRPMTKPVSVSRRGGKSVG